jgi:hypothetical protein
LTGGGAAGMLASGDGVAMRGGQEDMGLLLQKATACISFFGGL